MGLALRKFLSRLVSKKRTIGRPNVVEDDATREGSASELDHPAEILQNEPTLASTAMLQNTIIYGGNFMQHIVNNRRGLELLEKHVATAAFHNSAQRNEPPKCHPKTRVKILRSIYDWIVQPEQREDCILWLNGAAGAGKSAIMQSIAERSDETRNTTAGLFATLAYQLAQAIPETLDDILLTIERNPLVFDQSLESQFHQLLIQPLLRLTSHLRWRFVVFIDGLDECVDRSHQSILIKLFGTVAHSKSISIVFLIASRREPQIESAFTHNLVSQILRTVALDNSDVGQTRDDIRRFLVDKFTEIKTTHLRRHLLPSDWPPISMVDEIVTKASGQFIFASIVINYILSPRTNPVRQLDIIHDISLRDPSFQNPFLHLDALYRHIFSRVQYLDKVLDILAYHIITGHYVIEGLEARFELQPGELEVLFADLTAVIHCEPTTTLNSHMKLLHASLPDFLQDPSRSELYYININEYQEKLLCMFLERMFPDPLSTNYDYDVVAEQEYWRLGGIGNLLQRIPKEVISERLHCALQNFRSTFHSVQIDNVPFNAMNRVIILRSLKTLELPIVYQHVMDMFADGYAKFWPALEDEVKEEVRASSDLYTHIRELWPEVERQLLL